MKTKCKCGSEIESDGARSMKRCICGVKWGYSINIDNTIHLFHNGRKPIASRLRKRAFTVSSNEEQERKIRGAGYTRQELFDFAYRVKVLGLDN